MVHLILLVLQKNEVSRSKYGAKRPKAGAAAPKSKKLGSQTLLKFANRLSKDS